MTYQFCKLLGERLRIVIDEKREELGYKSDYELCEKSGVPQSILYRLLNGETYDPSFRQLVRLARYLEVSLDTFIDSDELKNYDYNIEDPNRPVRNKADRDAVSEE